MLQHLVRASLLVLIILYSSMKLIVNCEGAELSSTYLLRDSVARIFDTGLVECRLYVSQGRWIGADSSACPSL